MDRDFQDDDFDRTIKLRRFPSSHLSAPLTYYPQRLILKAYNSSTVPNVRAIKEGVRLLEGVNSALPGIEFVEDATPVYYHLFQSCYEWSGNKHSGGYVNPELFALLQSASIDTAYNFEAIRFHHKAAKILEFNMSADYCKTVAERVNGAYSIYRGLITVRGTIQRNSITNDKAVHGPVVLNQLKLFFSGDMIVFKYTDEPLRAVLMSYDQLVMLCDTIASRMMTMIVCCSNDLIHYDMLPPFDLVIRLYRWGDEMINSCHMNAYAIIGEFESIVTSVFVTFADTDVLELGKDYKDSVIETAEEIREKLSVPIVWTTELILLLKGIPSVNVLSEIFGLRKHWGNPMVDAAASGRAVQEKLNEDIPIKGTAMVDLLAAFNRMVVSAFLKLHGRWPECTLLKYNGDESYPLYDAWENNITIIPEKHEDHMHFHWTLVKFDSNCILDQHENQLSLLSDKSVSLPVSQLDAIYAKGLRPNDSSYVSENERRLILEFLRKDQMSIVDILEMVMKGEIPADLLANSASVKGTELKLTAGRIFAVLTYEMRQYFAVTESMIKNNLFPYNPHQTMTMSEAELMARLRQVTSQMDMDGKEKTLSVMHIIDFSKWNLRMRYENTCLVFKSIDDFLGTPGLIESSHHIFESMVNVVQDAFNPPEGSVHDTESDTIWRNHNRGWEGQRQKGWTLLTSALLSDLERRTGIHSIICGQGDNQTLLSHFPIPSQYRNAKNWIERAPQQVKRLLDDYYHKLELACLDVGLKVKTAESCRSLYFMNYGKRLFVGGVELSMNLKRVSKSVTESNDAFPTSEMRLKTAQGATYAAGLYSNPSPWPYWTSKVSTLLILLESYTNNPLNGDEGKRTADVHCRFDSRFLSILSKVPASLGGPPQQPFSAFFCRGHPDPLCEDLVMITMRARARCPVSCAIIECTKQDNWIKSSGDSRNSLIMSPYSLNLAIPSSATVPLSQAVLPALSGHCKNSMVTSLLSFEMNDYEDKLLKVISTLSPFNPMVANDIYSRSLVGQRQSFVSGLQNATSLCRLVMDHADSRIVNKVLDYERRQLAHWTILVMSISERMGKCRIEVPLHHVWAQELREKSWQTDIEGVTVPHPLELFQMVEADDDCCENHDIMNTHHHLLVIRHSDNLFGPPGSDNTAVQLIRSKTGKPYIGSRVTEGIVSKQVICKSNSPSWSDSCRLNVLRRWICKDDSNLDKFLKQLVSTRTNSSLSFLDKVTGRPSRLSYSHRASLLSTKKTCSITTTSNMLTRVYVSSNRMEEYSAGDQNYHLSFGSSFLVFGALVCLMGTMPKSDTWRTRNKQIFHCHLFHKDVPVVYDGVLDIDKTEGLNVYIKDPPRILYADVDSLVFDDLSYNATAASHISVTDARMFQCCTAYGFVLLGDLFVREIATKEMFAMDLHTYYTPRESAITLNDVKLTNVVGLIRAAANSTILVLPPEVHWIDNDESFICIVTNFLEGLSDSFWANLSTPFIHESVVSKLISLAGLLPDSYKSSDVGSLKTVLQAAIALEVFNLTDDLRKSIRYEKGSAICLAVPNLNAAKYLYSKYVELCIWYAHKNANSNMYSGHDMGRRLVRLLHSFEGDTMAEFSAFASSEVSRIFEIHNSEPENPKLVAFIPSITMLNVADPWVDRLRAEARFEPETCHVLVKQNKPGDVYSQSYYTFSIHHDELYVEHERCTCARLLKMNEPRVEFFFNRSGVFGIQQTLILGALRAFELPLTSVIVFGDTEGDVSLSIANESTCNTIYVGGVKEVTDYDPHAVGSYIPTSFIGSHVMSKLYLSSQAAVVGNALLDKQSNIRVLKQLSTRQWVGIVCVFDETIDMSSPSSLVFRNLNRVIRSVPDVEWVVVLSTVFCKHDIQVVLTALSLNFEVVSTHQPMISRPSARQFITMGCKRRKAQHPIPENSILLQFEKMSDLERCIRLCGNRNTPQAAYQSKVVQRILIARGSSNSNNFRMLCSKYISGWGRTYDEGPNRKNMLKDLRDIQSSMNVTIKKLGAYDDYLKGGNRIRRYVLNLNTPEHRVNVKYVFLKWIKCDIMIRLLSSKLKSLKELAARLKELLTVNYAVRQQDNTGYLNVDVLEFYEKSSDAVFGILGHVLGTTYATAERPNQLLIHCVHWKKIVRESFAYPQNLMVVKGEDYAHEMQDFDEALCQATSVFMSYLLFEEEFNCNFTLLPHAQHIIHQAEVELPISNDVGSFEQKNQLFWWPNTCDSKMIDHILMINLLECNITAIIHRKDTAWFFNHYNCSQILRVPGSGITPSLFLVNIEGFNNLVSTDSHYINYHSTINVAFSGGKTDECHCYDCTTIEYLKTKVSIGCSTYGSYL